MKSWRRWFSVVAGALVIFFLTTIPVLAAEGAEQDPAESTGRPCFLVGSTSLLFSAGWPI